VTGCTARFAFRWAFVMPIAGSGRTCHQVREQLQPWEHPADIVTIPLPPGMPWHNIEATLQAAAPSSRRCAQGAPPQSARPLPRWRPRIATPLTAGPPSGRIDTHGCTVAPLAAARHNQ
jgi:hypothetical protein